MSTSSLSRQLAAADAWLRPPDVSALADGLDEFARGIATPLPIQACLDQLLERIVDVLPVTAAGLTLPGNNYGRSFVSGSIGWARDLELAQAGLDQGPGLTAQRTDAVVSVPFLMIDQRFERFSPPARVFGVQAVFAFPMRFRLRQIGVLGLYVDSPGDLDPATVAAAKTVAEVAAAYLMVETA